MGRLGFVDIEAVRIRYFLHDGPASGPIVLGVAPPWKAATSTAGMNAALEAVSTLARGITIEAPCVGDSSDVPLDYFAKSGTVSEGLAEIWTTVLRTLAIDVSDTIIFAHCAGGTVASALATRLRLAPRLVVMSGAIDYADTRNRDQSTFARHPGGLWQHTLEGYRRFHPSATEEDVRRANERAHRVRPLRAYDLVAWGDGFRYFPDPETRKAKFVLVYPERDHVRVEHRKKIASDLRAEVVTIGGVHDPTKETLHEWLSTYRACVAQVVKPANEIRR